ncbi:MAG: hypothetical protein N4A65_09855 [Cohaesibacter sp.]|jgi:hypothetical protein|nr:hypothetical protein [Cohaesibacter sp.]
MTLKEHHRSEPFSGTLEPSSGDQEAGQAEMRRIILWSSGIFGVIAVVGLSFWSQAGSAVFFDRISGAIAGCF